MELPQVVKLDGNAHESGSRGQYFYIRCEVSPKGGPGVPQIQVVPRQDACYEERLSNENIDLQTDRGQYFSVWCKASSEGCSRYGLCHGSCVKEAITVYAIIFAILD